MKSQDLNFKLNFLDHVAIRVLDIQRSVEWYVRVLGLKEYRVPEWDPFPVFLLAGKTGIALFPAHTDDKELDAASLNVKIDHYAFNVSNEDFQKAIKHYEALGLSFTVKDHTYFHSVYTKDPDGHTVELTTLVVDEKDFYKDL